MTTNPTQHNMIHRRTWLRSGLAVSASLMAAVHARSTMATEAAGRIVPGLNAYSFLERLNARAADRSKGMDLFDVCEFCVKHEIEAVDLTGYFFPNYPDSPPDDYISRIKKFTHDRGIVISGTGIKNDFVTADADVRAEGMILIRRWIEVAAKLGAPVLRVFAGPTGKVHDWREASGGLTRDQLEQRMADDLRVCAEHGKRFGVIVAVQNHGDFLSTGPEHISLLKRVDHPWCGALVDTGKYFSDDPYADIEMMVPYAVNWQIKETLGSSLKSPAADMDRLVKIIVRGGYRGFVPIETLAMGRKDYDPEAEVVKVLTSLRAAINA